MIPEYNDTLGSKYYDVFEQLIFKIANKSSTRWEAALVGIFMIVLGYLFCFHGNSMITIIFSTLCTGIFCLLMTEFFLILFNVPYYETGGIVCSIFGLIFAIPLGYFSASVADKYAIPFFAGLTAVQVTKIICQMLGIGDQYYLTSMLELISFLVG